MFVEFAPIDGDSRGIAIRVRDQGTGFDPATLADPQTPENLTRPSGRGTFLTRIFMQTKTFSRVVANLAWQHVRFPGPVHDGETVYAETTVVDARPSRSRQGQGIVHLGLRAATEDGRPVCTFERKVLIYARGQGPYDGAGY